LKENKRDLMKTISMVLAAMICLPILASAAPDSVVTGPYNITFDLGIPKEAYKVEIKEPITKESLSGDISTNYEISLVNKTGLTRRAGIYITSHETEQVLPTQDELVRLVKNAILEAEDTHDVKAAKRTIDGHDGAIVSAETKIDTEYLATYYLSSTEMVTIVSLYPWEESTLSLFKTIHAEKINSTS